MARQKIVVDASVIVKWFVDEEYSTQALAFRADHVSGKTLLIIPELTFLEVLNALRYKGGSIKSLTQANEALWDVQFHVEKINRFLLEKASILALEYKLSLYDALYLALGLLYGSIVVTADVALAKAPNTILLGK